MRGYLVISIVVTVCSTGLGQDFLVNGNFEGGLGAKAFVTIEGDVADGDTIEVDTGGVNRVYEFDTDGTLNVGDVPVDVSGGLGSGNAKSQFRDAVNADGSATWTANRITLGDRVLLTWTGAGSGIGNTNTNTIDANGGIDVTDFGAPDCIQDFEPAPPWDGIPGSRSNGITARNGDVFIPPCPRDPGGENNVAYAAIQGFGTDSGGSISQTVTGLSVSNTYEFKGWLFLGHQGDFGQTLARVQLFNDTPLGGGVEVDRFETLVKLSQSPDWIPFSVNGSPKAPSGTKMRVVVTKDAVAGSGLNALHVTGCHLIEALCTSPPRLSLPTINPDKPLAPRFAVTDTMLDDALVTGESFVPGLTTVKLIRSGETDITASDVNVAGDGLTLTCDFDLTGAATGYWALEVDSGDVNCPVGVGSNALNIIGTDLVNGGFELPAAAGACPVVPIASPPFPDGWHFLETAEYGYTNALTRDNDVFVPTCDPLPEGDHYGSSTSNVQGAGSATAVIYQTIEGQVSTTYTFSGFFAGGGENQVTLDIRSGGADGGTFAGPVTVYDGAVESNHDWRFRKVRGQSFVNTVMATPRWNIAPLPPPTNGQPPHASHADDLRFGVCTAAPTVTGTVAPAIGEEDTVVNITSLPGTGYTGTPQVIFQNADHSILATNVVVSGPGDNITCSVDLTGAPVGAYDVIVRQGVCVVDDQLLGAFTVLAVNPCPDPFANTDGDTDVDHDDFGAMQACLTGDVGPVAAGCECFDVEPNDNVNQLDVAAFEACASGPGVVADICCDGGIGCP